MSVSRRTLFGWLAGAAATPTALTKDEVEKLEIPVGTVQLFMESLKTPVQVCTTVIPVATGMLTYHFVHKRWNGKEWEPV